MGRSEPSLRQADVVASTVVPRVLAHQADLDVRKERDEDGGARVVDELELVVQVAVLEAPGVGLDLGL